MDERKPDMCVLDGVDEDGNQVQVTVDRSLMQQGVQNVVAEDGSLVELRLAGTVSI